MRAGLTWPSSWPGNWVSQYGSRFFSIPVSDATLSASPYRPQLQAGTGWPAAEQPVHRDPHVPELPRHPGGPVHHLARLDHAAAEPGADDRGDRGPPRRLLGPEVHVVGVQRGGVGVVVVHDGNPDPGLQRAADVEAAPGRVAEVGGALQRDDAVRADRARRVQPDRAHLGPRDPGELEHLRPGTGPAPRWPSPGPPARSSGTRPSGPPGTGPRSRGPSRCSSFRRCRGRPRPSEREPPSTASSSDGRAAARRSRRRWVHYRPAAAGWSPCWTLAAWRARPSAQRCTNPRRNRPISHAPPPPLPPSLPRSPPAR